MDAGFVPSIKCVLIGDYEVGKTSLINAFATREPLNQYFPGRAYSLTHPRATVYPLKAVTGPVQIHIEHAFRLYWLHVHDTEGSHAPTPMTTPDPSPPLDDVVPPVDLSEVSINVDDSNNEDPKSYSARWISRRVEYGLADIVLICFSLANRASFENVETVWRKEIEQFCPHIPFIIIGCKLDLRRPDPTTPAMIPKQRRHPSSPIIQLRRPKLARLSTAGTAGSNGPGSLSNSDFGHHTRVPESSVSQTSITQPVSILTNAQPTLSPSSKCATASEQAGGSSSSPPSDIEATTGNKLKSKMSLPTPFQGVRVFRRKSVTDVSSSLSRPPSSFSLPGTRTTPSTVDPPTQVSRSDPTPTSCTSISAASPSPVGTTSPKNLRHITIPPFIRSISHSNVFRKVLSRSRSGTLTIESPTEITLSSNNPPGPGPSMMTAPPATTRDALSRPLLSHRFTSGSADKSSVRKLHSHVRTSSQPSPTSPDLHPDEIASGRGLEGSGSRVALVTGGPSLAVVPGSDRVGGSGSATSSNPRPSPGKGNMTRIEEPPLAMRHRTTTYQEARATAKRLGASGYMECSSLTLVNVLKVFDEAVRIAVERRQASASSLHGHGRRGRQKEECVVM